MSLKSTVQLFILPPMPPVKNHFPDPAIRRKFQQRLLRWYARYRRDLPWRKTSDPYEVMPGRGANTSTDDATWRDWSSAVTNHAAQLAIIKHVTRQESRSSAGNCQADEPTGITQLSWQLSCR